GELQRERRRRDRERRAAAGRDHPRPRPGPAGAGSPGLVAAVKRGKKAMGGGRFQSIGVLMGGTSSERDVSLRTGGAVANALRSLGHKVTQIDIRSETGPD